MNVVTIKAKSASLVELHARANVRASGLAEQTTSPVLVVYQKQGASLYYENESGQERVKAPSRPN